VAVVLTLVQTKQIINIHKRNNTKNTVQTIQSTVNTSTHITKTPTQYKTHTYTHPHITKQVKINTVHDIPKLNIIIIMCIKVRNRTLEVLCAWDKLQSVCIC
jgi:hypothetical protein